MSGSFDQDFNSLTEHHQFLEGLFGCPIVGIAIMDKQLRFQHINRALAKMNGLPSRAHFGKTVDQILGSFASQVMPALESVLRSGQATSNLHVEGKLQARVDEGHWIENYFPITDSSRKVQRVAAVVIEVPGVARSASQASVPSELQAYAEQTATALASQPQLLRQIQKRFDPLWNESVPDLFQGLDDHVIRGIIAAGRRCTRYAGDLFCRQGEPATKMFLLTKGTAKISRVTRAGKQVLLGWKQPGCAFGLDALSPTGAEYTWNVSAATNSEALEWSTETLNQFAERYPRISRNALSIAVRCASELQERLDEVSTKAVEQRLAHLILTLAERSSKDARAEIRASDEELAQMTGTTLFTVNKTIRSWQRMGYVDKSRRRLCIVDRRQLSRLSSARG